MKFFVAAVAVAATGAVAHSNVTYVTETVDQIVTYCPEATQITHGTKTWTVTAPTTLTITDCPCTVTRPVTVTSSVVCHNCPKPTGAPSSNATVPANPTQSTIPPTAGAAKAVPALAGLLGLVAALL